MVWSCAFESYDSFRWWMSHTICFFFLLNPNNLLCTYAATDMWASNKFNKCTNNNNNHRYEFDLDLLLLLMSPRLETNGQIIKSIDVKSWMPWKEWPYSLRNRCQDNTSWRVKKKKMKKLYETETRPDYLTLNDILCFFPIEKFAGSLIQKWLFQLITTFTWQLCTRYGY